MKQEVQVPGLYRGIMLWEMLCSTGEQSLEQLSEKSGYPKASVMRMLQTLCHMGLVERESKSKLYHATARIVRSDIQDTSFPLRVQQCIQELSTELGVTAEWYEPFDSGMKITQRYSPPSSEVFVAARIGFIRIWNGELESVAQLAYAFCPTAPDYRLESDLWLYDPNGEKANLSASDTERIVSQVRERKVAIDSSYNTHGIKRIACPVIRDEQFLGILSLPLIFTPSLESEMERYKPAITAAAELLQS